MTLETRGLGGGGRSAVAGAEATNVGEQFSPPAVRQVALPTLPAVSRTGPAVAFAHPAERELARLLTFYGVRWSYEPTMFSLAAGDPHAAGYFTPDFYLPDFNLYLELTTMRQRLVTRKNRKLRLVRERYPGVSIKLLYRRDYLRLIDAYAPWEAGPPAAGEVLIPAPLLAERIEALADELAATWPETVQSPPLLLALGAGARRFHTALGEALLARGRSTVPGRLAISSFAPGRGAGGRARVTLTAPAGVGGQRVILLQDIVSSGLSLACALDWLRRHGAAGVTVCSLLERPAARLLDVPVAHVGFAVAAPIVAGFGLSRCPALRRLPHLTTVAPGEAVDAG